jgi:hypothetical protein
VLFVHIKDSFIYLTQPRNFMKRERASGLYAQPGETSDVRRYAVSLEHPTYILVSIFVSSLQVCNCHVKFYISTIRIFFRAIQTHFISSSKYLVKSISHQIIQYTKLSNLLSFPSPDVHTFCCIPCLTHLTSTLYLRLTA